MASILVVDDESYVTRLLKLRLEKHGHAVETANDGDEALEKLDRSEFDVVITDFNMPGLDGRQLCLELRARGGDPPVPVFLVTARIDSELTAWVESLPRCEFIEKPISVRRLLGRLDAVLGSSEVGGGEET